MLHIRAHSLNLRTGLLLLLILAVRGQEGLPPAVTTWSKGTFAARISKHSSCYKALDPAADVSKLWPGAQRAVAEGILADYEEGSKYPFFRVFGNGSRFVRPEPSEITLRVINAGPGTTGTRSIHGMGCAAGYKQVHYDRICNLDGEQKAATDHLLRMHVKMRECSRHAADGGGVQKTPECLTATVLDEFREALIRAATSGVEVIADNPYNNFLPQWLEINPDLKVMMSLRNPEDWAVSRVKHRWDRLVRCRDGTKRSATYMNYLDCMQGTEYVGESLLTLDEEHVPEVSELLEHESLRFAIHCAFVNRTVKPENLHELCIFDYDRDSSQEQRQIIEEVEDLLAIGVRGGAASGPPL